MDMLHRQVFWDHIPVVEYVTASVLWYFETGEKAYLLVCLTSDTFNRARAEFGRAHHVGRSMPSELPKSWDYVHYAWNTFARTPVASAIESITGGDESSITFRLFGDGSKKKKKKKKGSASVRLTIPQDFDVRVHKVAALVNHFHSYYGTDELYGMTVSYKQSKLELKRITQVSASVGLSSDDPTDKESMLQQELRGKGVVDEEMIGFVVALSSVVGHQRSPDVLLTQWRSVIKTCSSHWCPKPLWWCVASTLVGDNLLGMTRHYEGGVVVPATCLENWDMLTLLKLLQTNVMTEKVNKAAGKIMKYTRNDLAHERFDGDWVRDWSCMEELLTALGCSSAAGKLRKFCEPLNKSHRDSEGDTYSTYVAPFHALYLNTHAHTRIHTHAHTRTYIHTQIHTHT